MSLFKTILHGYLGADPELTEVQSDKGPYKKVSFSVCVSRDGDGKDWVPCVMYGKRAEVIEKYFKKGSEIIISDGRFESYKPKDDPNRKNWILKVKDFDFAGKSDSPKTDYNPSGFEEVEEDIPF